MRNVTMIGAGKTGRGFIARLLNESGVHVNFIDKDEALVSALRKDGKFDVSFFGGRRETYTVENFTANTWETAEQIDEFVLVSVCGPNLADVGAELRKRLDPAKHYYIVTCENYSHPSRILREAIGMDNISVSESTVFCTTIENGGYNISSENYPYLQCDADLLDGYDPGIAGIRPLNAFGNFLTRKLFTYNAASCVIAYLGWLRGYSDYADAANDAEVLALLDRNYAVTNRVLCREFGYEEQDQAEFAALSKAKFTDRTIADTVARNAREPQRKLGREERIIGPLLVMNKYGEDASVLEMTVAAMLHYDNEGEDKWRAIKAEKSPEAILREICGLDESSPSYANILAYYREFAEKLG
ncbi:MAG: hypothetical protein J6B77_05550 [Clostridia bacterium]|nr:hypothetical protein [Clostridia bacterium]